MKPIVGGGNRLKYKWRMDDKSWLEMREGGGIICGGWVIVEDV